MNAQSKFDENCYPPDGPDSLYEYQNKGHKRSAINRELDQMKLMINVFYVLSKTFSHGQFYVALSRIRYYNTIRLIVTDNNVFDKDLGKYPSVIELCLSKCNL